MKIAAIALTLGMAIMPQNSQEKIGPFTNQYGKTFEVCKKDCGSFKNLKAAGNITANQDFAGSVDVATHNGRIVKLSDDEYAKLQKMRQAVNDEETAIARAHGVSEGQHPCPPSTYAVAYPCLSIAYIAPDVYEFRGQFLLVNVPNTEGKL